MVSDGDDLDALGRLGGCRLRIGALVTIDGGILRRKNMIAFGYVVRDLQVHKTIVDPFVADNFLDYRYERLAIHRPQDFKLGKRVATQAVEMAGHVREHRHE